MKTNSGISLTALATASLFAAASAAPAAAQDATVIQADEETKQNSTAVIEQEGRNNDANGEFDSSSVTLFDGTQIDLAPNGAGIYQDGSGSTARIEQFGDYNDAGINQADSVGGGADSSTAVILQGESGNEARYSTAYIDQQGDASTVRIEQNGSFNDSFAFQRGNLDGNQTGNIQTQIIDGDRNRTEIVQTMGIANEAGITLSTDRNNAFILQDADRDKASVDIIGGDRNEVEIRQTGSSEGNNADVDIDGRSNESAIAQGGAGGQHEATLTQNGTNLVASIEQEDTSEAGEGNLATVNQTGRYSRAEVVQDGSGGGNNAQIAQEPAEFSLDLNDSRRLVASIMQDGEGGSNKADIDQTGSRHEAIITQGGLGGGSVASIDQSTDRTRRNTAKITQMIDATSGTDEVDIDQGGDNNEAIAMQNRLAGGTGNTITITQPGDRNEADVEQTGEAQLANVAQGGRRGEATIMQAGFGRNTADIDQAGSRNVGMIDQSGSGGGSVAAIDQSASGARGNEASIEQRIDASSGTDNADIDQGGSRNEATIAQTRANGGTGSTASITQPGDSTMARIEQDGSNLKAAISLNGRRNEATITQAGSGTSATASIATGSGASYNEASIKQASGGVIGSIDQTSRYNEASIVQANAQPQNGTVEADIDQGSGDFNEAEITQEGAGTSYTATIAQAGRRNRAFLTQAGPGNNITATLQQTGSYNFIRASQTAEGGNNLALNLQQQGNRNRIEYDQRGFNLGGEVSQDGNSNFVDVTQNGSGYDVTITQKGDRNSFSMTYTGPTPEGGGYTVTQTN